MRRQYYKNLSIGDKVYTKKYNGGQIDKHFSYGTITNMDGQNIVVEHTDGEFDAFNPEFAHIYKSLEGFDVRKLFGTISKSGTKFTRENWDDMNLEKSTYIQLSDKSVKAISVFDGFDYSTTSCLLQFWEA